MKTNYDSYKTTEFSIIKYKLVTENVLQTVFIMVHTGDMV